MSDALSPPGLRSLRQMSGMATPDVPVDWRFHFGRACRALVWPYRTRLVRRDAIDLGRRAFRMARALSRKDDAHLQRILTKYATSATLKNPFGRRSARLLAAVGVLASRHLNLSPFVSQYAGAALLLSGRLAEMETGSGKTLVAAMAAGVAARVGETAHVITANDYLAERDLNEMRPLFEALDLKTGLINHNIVGTERRAAYAAQVLYASNKEIAFDYLRDRITMGAEAGPVSLTLEPVYRDQARTSHLLMRGLPFAIVDEADSVLVDECRTPLIISAEDQPDPDWAKTALALGDLLQPNRDYTIDSEMRRVKLSHQGRGALAGRGEELGGIWRNTLRREAAARLAVGARHLYHRDEHYIVSDDKLVLIDEYTGRTAPDRALAEGLHQIIEAKEGIKISGRRFTKGRTTYQRFFRRYARIAGMTGTAREVAGELAAIHGLQVVTLPPERRSRRRIWRTRICRSSKARQKVIVGRVRGLIRRGRPVLIATRTVKASEEISAVLTEEGIEHSVLNAAQDSVEANIIAEAGQRGRVTVATNMAGRGVDIRLDAEVEALGGLHVILTERHEAGRIDRQVIGRAARQGNRGSAETILSWTDPLVETFGGWRGRWRLGGSETFDRAQTRAERLHAQARMDLLRQDQRRDEQLSFTGSVE